MVKFTQAASSQRNKPGIRWMCPRADLDVVEKRKIPAHAGN